MRVQATVQRTESGFQLRECSPKIKGLIEIMVIMWLFEWLTTSQFTGFNVITTYTNFAYHQLMLN